MSDPWIEGEIPTIERYGFVRMIVAPQAGDPGPSWGYTVGMSRHDHPEFVIVGAPRQLTGDLLWDLASAVIRSGMRFAHGDELERLTSGVVGLVEVSQGPTDLLNAAEALRVHDGRTGPVAALQVTFPDREGQIPWGSDLDGTNAPIHGQSPAAPVRQLSLPDRASRDAAGWYVDS